FLEYDDARSGDFKPLRFLPKGKTVVLGLVTTKLGQLESKDDLKRRIDEAAKYVPLEQLCISPQCGFSSTVHGNAIAGEAQRAALSAARPSAAALAPSRSADFGSVAAAPDVRRVADWVVASADHGTRPFAVIDKTEARLYVFAPTGRLVGTSPVLLGLAHGDD